MRPVSPRETGESCSVKSHNLTFTSPRLRGIQQVPNSGRNKAWVGTDRSTLHTSLPPHSYPPPSTQPKGSQRIRGSGRCLQTSASPGTDGRKGKDGPGGADGDTPAESLTHWSHWPLSPKVPTSSWFPGSLSLAVKAAPSSQPLLCYRCCSAPSTSWPFQKQLLVQPLLGFSGDSPILP